MYNPYNPIGDIDRRIEDLERLKKNYQIPQQPINIFNNTQTPNNSMINGRILNENEKVDEILVSNKTLLFSPFMKKLYIKENNGDFVEYEVIMPLTKEEQKIKELEEKLYEYEQIINANNEKQKSTSTNKSINAK